MSIGDLLKGLFSDDAPPRPRPASAAAAGNVEPVLNDLTERLNKMLWNRRAILSGNIHLLGLSRIKEHVGSDWPRIAERAQDIAHKAIQRVCTPDDVFTRYDELSYLVIFANLTKDQAQLRCVEIAEDIARRLLGDNFVDEAAEVSTGVFETDGSLIFNAISKQDLIKKLTGQLSSRASVQKGSGGSEEEETEPSFDQFQMDKTKALASLRVLYQPMCNLRHQVVANYFAVATATNVFGATIWDTAVRAEFAAVLSSTEFDVFVARNVMRDLGGHMAKGIRILMGWPVHFDTLATRANREAYFEVCREIPETIRQLLVLELDGLPEGVPNSRLLELTTVMKSFCRTIIVRVPADFRRFEVFQGCNLGAVGFSLSGVSATDAQRISLMNKFVEAASRAHLKAYVHGLSSRAQVLAAVTAGFEWIDGVAVEKPVQAPGQMHRFSVEDLYRDLEPLSG